MGSNTKTNKRKKWPFVLIVVVLLAVSAVLIVPRIWTRGFPDPANSMIARTEVTTGDISTTVVGSGNLAQKIEEAKLPYGVTVKTVLAESGDAAQKGDVLAEVSLPSVANCVAEVKDALAGIETDMKNLIANNTETVSVKSKTAARVKKIYAADGQAAADVVAANGALLLLSLDGKMAVAFSSETVLAAGSAVTVTLSDGTEKESSVLTASAGTYVATLSDDGTILGDQVTVKSGEEAVG
ncbi:MAG: hypothetical protein LBO81_00440, partial [Clostridiales Family XIII bacterium]|nr:hypothetical protein [Clostridiales Family XIII bacterium]